jgi:hypothetical protein
VALDRNRRNRSYHHGMAEPTKESASARRAHQAPSRDRSQLPVIIVGVIALAACALAGWALLRPVPKSSASDASSASYTDAQRSDSKNKICGAFNIVRTGVTQNTNLTAPGGPGDVTGALAVAANARLSLYNGGQYLLARLDPATPPELAEAVRDFGNGLMDIGAAATAGAQNSEPAQAARLRDADAANTKIVAACQ